MFSKKATKKWRNFHLRFDVYYIFKVKSKVEISSIFVAFLENMNFTQNHYMKSVQPRSTNVTLFIECSKKACQLCQLCSLCSFKMETWGFDFRFSDSFFKFRRLLTASRHKKKLPAPRLSWKFRDEGRYKNLGGGSSYMVGMICPTWLE